MSVQSPFTERQLESLRSAFHRGASDASDALGRWLGITALMTLESIDQLPLADATSLLSADDAICFCSMSMPDALPGEMLVAFDDVSGFALADMALGRTVGTADQWGEMERSAALESSNILCCSFLNAIVAELANHSELLGELIPAPPQFRREFAESLLEFALMGQAVESDRVIVVRTRFEADGQPLDWTLLWVPDAQALNTLREVV